MGMEPKTSRTDTANQKYWCNKIWGTYLQTTYKSLSTIKPNIFGSGSGA